MKQPKSIIYVTLALKDYPSKKNVEQIKQISLKTNEITKEW